MKSWNLTSLLFTLSRPIFIRRKLLVLLSHLCLGLLNVFPFGFFDVSPYEFLICHTHATRRAQLIFPSSDDPNNILRRASISNFLMQSCEPPAFPSPFRPYIYLLNAQRRLSGMSRFEYWNLSNVSANIAAAIFSVNMFWWNVFGSLM